MASSEEFVKYAADQMCGAGEITYRKMFGEYGLYCNGKLFALICDNQLFVKFTEVGGRIWPDLEQAPPYEGAKPYFLVEDVDNGERLTKFVTATCAELPPPKPKKGRKKQ